MNLLTDEISIPDDLAEKLKKRAEEKEFKSLSAYVAYILRQVLANVEKGEKEKNEVIEKKDEEEVKQRLRDMGYLE